MTHTVSLVQQSFVHEMSQHLSQLGSLPNPAADTHSHYQSRPILAHELEEATYDSDDLHVGSIVEWAGKQQPPPRAVVHIDIRSPDHTQVYCCCQGWSTRPWVGLKGALPGILALRLIPGEKTVESLLGIMGGHGQGGKPREGVCKVYPVDNLITLPLGCDMVALQEFDVLEKEDHCTLPFRWQISQPNWWDDLAITPTHPWVAPEHPLPNLTTPTLYSTTYQAWYRGLALPHPFITTTPLSAKARYPTPPFMPPPAPPWTRVGSRPPFEGTPS